MLLYWAASGALASLGGLLLRLRLRLRDLERERERLCVLRLLLCCSWLLPVVLPAVFAACCGVSKMP